MNPDVSEHYSPAFTHSRFHGTTFIAACLDHNVRFIAPAIHLVYTIHLDRYSFIPLFFELPLICRTANQIDHYNHFDRYSSEPPFTWTIIHLYRHSSGPPFIWSIIHSDRISSRDCHSLRPLFIGIAIHLDRYSSELPFAWTAIIHRNCYSLEPLIIGAAIR